MSNRIGIVNVSTTFLEDLLKLPHGTHIFGADCHPTNPLCIRLKIESPELPEVVIGNPYPQVDVEYTRIESRLRVRT